MQNEVWVLCPRHGATFDIKTGKDVRGAKMGPLRFMPADTRAYVVKAEGEDILIGIE